MREFDDSEGRSAADSMAFEKAFRGMFRSMEPLEEITRFARYPNVSVYPIAIYRIFRGAEPASDGAVT